MPIAAPQMRVKLAESAFELFSQRGFQNVNLDIIAAHAGVTKGSLYWHYDSKKEVITAACSHYYRRWQQRAHAEIAIGKTAFERIERVIRMSVEDCLFDSQSRIFTTEVFAMSLQDEQIRHGWAQFYDTVRELFVGLLHSAIVEGAVEVEDPRGSVDWMMATIEGIKQLAAFEPAKCTPSERESVVRGLMQIMTGSPGTPDRGPG